MLNHHLHLFAPLLCLLTSGPPVDPGGADGGKPAAEEIERAGELVRRLFRDDYRSRDPAVRVHLARKLVERAGQSPGSVAEKYFLLTEASQLAARHGDVLLARDAVEELAGSFDVDVFELQWENLKLLATSVTPDGNAEGALLQLHEAVAGEGWLRRGPRESLQMSSVIARVMRRSRSAFLASRADALLRRARSNRKEIEIAHEAWIRHSGARDDPAAAAAIGRFRCFVLEDWEGGLPDLARGIDPGLHDAAEKDLARPSSPREQIALALTWVAEAGDEEGIVADSILARARHWYEKAKPGLGPSERERLDASIRPAPWTHLADLEAFDIVVGWGEYCNDGSLHTEGPLTIRGYHDRKGLLTHPDEGASSRARFHLQGKYRTLSAWVGLPDRGSRFEGTLSFSVHGDGRELWRSKPLGSAAHLQPCTVDVRGVEVLELRVDCPGADTHAMASWVDARLAAR